MNTNNIQDYFEHIMTKIESERMGYAMSLYSKLSESEKAQFHDWLETTYYYDSHDSEQHGSVAEITDILN